MEILLARNIQVYDEKKIRCFAHVSRAKRDRRRCQEQSTIMIRAVLMLLLAASASAFVVPAAPLKAVAPTRSLDECRRTTAPKAIIG